MPLEGQQKLIQLWSLQLVHMHTHEDGFRALNSDRQRHVSFMRYTPGPRDGFASSKA